MKPEDDDGDFERWLDAELKRTLGSVKGPSPRAVQADYHAASRREGQLMTRMAVLAANGVAVFAAVALAVGGGAVVATATTGSANPAVWGQQVEALLSDQVLSNDRDTGPSSPADRNSSASMQASEERRSSNSAVSAPRQSDRSHESAGSRRGDSPRAGNRDGDCDDRAGRQRPSPSHRH